MSVIDAYLEKVAGQIRVRRAREPLTRELRDHMEAQTLAYQAEGLDEPTAQRKAVEDMGDALLVGGELDRVHRPRVQWKGLTLAMLMLCAGILLQALLEEGGLSDIGGKRLFATVACAGLMLFVSLSDYTWWVRLALPAAALWVALILFRVDLFLSIAWPGIRSAFILPQSALSLLFMASTPELLCLTAPAMLALLICALRGRGWGGYAACLTAATLPAALGFLYDRTGWNASIMTLLALLSFAVLCLAVRRDFFRVRRKAAFGLLAGVGLPALILFLSQLWKRLGPQEFFSESILPLLRGARWLGRGTGTVSSGMNIDGADLLPLAIHRLGWIPFILFTLGFAWMLRFCLRRFLRMENRMGAMIGWAAAATLTVQTLTYYLCAFTPYTENICLPLVSYGNVMLAGDALLAGLILSTLRGQTLPEPSRPSHRALA